MVSLLAGEIVGRGVPRAWVVWVAGSMTPQPAFPLAVKMLVRYVLPSAATLAVLLLDGLAGASNSEVAQGSGSGR